MPIITNLKLLSHYPQLAQTGLPDLTQAQYLNQIASQLPIAIAVFAILAIGLAAGMALLNFSLRNYPAAGGVAIGDWMLKSSRLLQVLQQILLVSVILLAGFGLCGTLTNQQNNWEQARVAKTTPAVSGELIQQSSPQVSYTAQEPYVYTTELNGKLVKVEDKKDVTRQSSVSGSNLQITVAPIQTKSADNQNYAIDFNGDYQITNPIGTTDRFVFQVSPPKGYSLLQNFGVTQNGKRLIAANPGEYRFPIQIAPGSVSKLRVSYRAQGSSPQWVYQAKDGSLANFRMTIATKVPNLNFISGIVPTKVTGNGDLKTFTWAFNQNASVQKPFGVEVSAPVAAQTGTLPLLLLLAPGIFLWWIVLLCFSIPMRLQHLPIAGFVFFAGMFALTYLSRIADPLVVWGSIAIGLLLLVWGLGRNNWRISLAAVICTIVGAIVPVYGFLLGSRGLVLSIAAVLSVVWLVVRNWYGWYQLQPNAHLTLDRTPAPSEAIFTRHDLLEESATYNQLNPSTPTAEEIAERSRNKGV